MVYTCLIIQAYIRKKKTSYGVYSRKKYSLIHHNPSSGARERSHGAVDCISGAADRSHGAVDYISGSNSRSGGKGSHIAGSNVLPGVPHIKKASGFYP